MGPGGAGKGSRIPRVPFTETTDRWRYGELSQRKPFLAVGRWTEEDAGKIQEGGRRWVFPKDGARSSMLSGCVCVCGGRGGRVLPGSFDLARLARAGGPPDSRAMVKPEAEASPVPCVR